MIRKKMNKDVLGGALSYHKNYLAGPYRGYYITIDYKKPVYVIYIHATFYNLRGAEKFKAFINEYKKTTQYVSRAEARQHTVKIQVVEPKQEHLTPSALNDAINPVIEQLLVCRYDTGCINCGDNDGVIDCYEISGYHHYLCEECVRDIEEEAKNKQIELKAITSNIALGTIGAFSGALIGVVAWVFVFANSIFSWLVSPVILLLAYKGYEMLGTRIDKKGFIVSSIIIFIMIFLGNHLAWVWAVLDTATLQGYSISEILMLTKILHSSNAVSHYFWDLIAGYIFTGAIGFRTIKRTYHKSISCYFMRKMNLQ